MGWLKEGIERQDQAEIDRQNKIADNKKKDLDARYKDLSIAQDYQNRNDRVVRKALEELAEQINKKSHFEIKSGIVFCTYELEDRMCDGYEEIPYMRYDIRWILKIYKRFFFISQVNHALLVQVGFGTVGGRGSRYTTPSFLVFKSNDKSSNVTVKRIHYFNFYPKPGEGSTIDLIDFGFKEGHDFSNLKEDDLKEAIVYAIKNKTAKNHYYQECIKGLFSSDFPEDTIAGPGNFYRHMEASPNVNSSKHY